MKTTITSAIRAAHHSFSGVVCLGIVIAMSSIAEAQNLFVGTSGGGTGGGNIYEFTPGGARSTFATGLSSPFGLAFDSTGNLFEADYGTQTIYEFTPGGARSTFATGFSQPLGLAFDSAGNLFVGDIGNGSITGGAIYKFTPGGPRSTFATGLRPYDFAFNSAGILFVSDGAFSIFEFTPDGTRSTFANGGGLNGLQGLAFDSTGNLFVANSSSGNILKYTPNGSHTVFASGVTPAMLAVDNMDNLFEADVSSGNVYEYTPSGSRSTFATGLSSPASLAFQVPEPTAGAMLATATASLLTLRRRKSM